MRALCATGCGQRAVHRHHAIKAQIIEREGGSSRDARWLLPLCLACHFNHEHGPMSAKLPLTVLPDAVFAVARVTFGAGRAFNELRRPYVGEDPRLDALLTEWEAGDVAA